MLLALFVEAYLLNVLIQIRLIALSVPGDVEILGRVDVVVLLPLLLKNIIIILVLTLLRDLVHKGDLLAVFAREFGRRQVHTRLISLNRVITALKISLAQQRLLLVVLTNIVSNIAHIKALIKLAASLAHLCILIHTGALVAILVSRAVRAEIFLKLINELLVVKHVHLGPKRIGNIDILHIYLGLRPIFLNTDGRLDVFVENIVRPVGPGWRERAGLPWQRRVHGHVAGELGCLQALQLLEEAVVQLVYRRFVVLWVHWCVEGPCELV